MEKSECDNYSGSSLKLRIEPATPKVMWDSRIQTHTWLHQKKKKIVISNLTETIAKPHFLFTTSTSVVLVNKNIEVNSMWNQSSTNSASLRASFKRVIIKIIYYWKEQFLRLYFLIINWCVLLTFWLPRRHSQSAFNWEQFSSVSRSWEREELFLGGGVIDFEVEEGEVK